MPKPYYAVAEGHTIGWTTDRFAAQQAVKGAPGGYFVKTGSKHEAQQFINTTRQAWKQQRRTAPHPTPASADDTGPAWFATVEDADAFFRNEIARRDARAADVQARREARTAWTSTQRSADFGVSVLRGMSYATFHTTLGLAIALAIQTDGVLADSDTTALWVVVGFYFAAALGAACVCCPLLPRNSEEVFFNTPVGASWRMLAYVSAAVLCLKGVATVVFCAAAFSPGILAASSGLPVAAVVNVSLLLADSILSTVQAVMAFQVSRVRSQPPPSYQPLASL